MKTTIERIVVASVSGGKDSVAMSLYFKEKEIEHRRVFMDTGWEADVTYEYLRNTLPQFIGPIEEIRGPLLMEDLVKKKGMFPSRLRRFCTEELKVKPMIRHIAQLQDEGHECVNAVGIRRAESSARSEALEREWSDAFDCEVWRPLIHWTMDDVVAIHKRHGVPPNPLYLMGATRVGCWPCIHSRKSEIRLVGEKDPGRIDRLRQLETDVGTKARERYAARGETMADPPSFFQAPIPVSKESSPGVVTKHYPPWPIDRVVEWSKTSHGGRQVDFLGGDSAAQEGCMRWGLCDSTPEE